MDVLVFALWAEADADGDTSHPDLASSKRFLRNEPDGNKISEKDSTRDPLHTECLTDVGGPAPTPDLSGGEQMRTQRPAPLGDALNDHLSGYRLWLYCFGRINGADSALVEEHLLVCEACRDRLDIVEMLASLDPETGVADPGTREPVVD